MRSSRILRGMGVVGVLVGLLAWSGQVHAVKPNPPGKQAGKFVVLGTGEVLDTTTSLRWQQTPGAPGDTNCDNDVLICEWQDAVNYCAALGGGYRLAEVKELISLVDYSETIPATALNTPNGPFSNVQSSTYWSAATTAGNPSDAWFVFFGNGRVGFLPKALGNHAWCVR